MSAFSKAVLVTGARQVGKTTMLKHLAAGRNRNYVTLDNLPARSLAKSDPVLFFQTYTVELHKMYSNNRQSLVIQEINSKI